MSFSSLLLLFLLDLFHFVSIIYHLFTVTSHSLIICARKINDAERYKSKNEKLDEFIMCTSFLILQFEGKNQIHFLKRNIRVFFLAFKNIVIAILFYYCRRIKKKNESSILECQKQKKNHY